MDADSGPIRSRYEDDPAYAEAIDAFVVSLAERVDELQDTELHGSLALLASRATKLGTDADAVGYPALQRGAAEVAEAAEQDNAELAYKAMVALTDLGRRVRQGHRGSL